MNVSRSFLQNDKQVQKISKHITKKVADKLISLFKNDREKYENGWEDVGNEHLIAIKFNLSAFKFKLVFYFGEI